MKAKLLSKSHLINLKSIYKLERNRRKTVLMMSILIRPFKY